MTLYSYIVKHDTGFAPNPFFGYCTLACCKPGIRRTAKEKDWIVGLTPKVDGNTIVYFMEVNETLGFDEYWHDQRFKGKRPTIGAGIASKCGDNIYQPSRNHSFGYRQLPSTHSKPQFTKHEDPERKEHDLGGEQVLVSSNFAYFGSKALPLPPELNALKIGIGHRSRSLESVQTEFRHFVSHQRDFGVVGCPGDWSRDDGSWKSLGCGSR
jgi:hypothetical protein